MAYVRLHPDYQPAYPEQKRSVTGSSWRYGIIAFAGFVLFLSGYISKAAGKVSFVEGVIILVGFFAIVIVVAMIIDRIRKT